MRFFFSIFLTQQIKSKQNNANHITIYNLPNAAATFPKNKQTNKLEWQSFTGRQKAKSCLSVIQANKHLTGNCGEDFAVDCGWIVCPNEVGLSL